jgi:anti-sigma factor ChrR (cupin superfamily)
MSGADDTNGKQCRQAEHVAAYAVHALPPSEVAALESHLATCEQCRLELESLRQVVDAFVGWPTDVLRPSNSLSGRLAQRIADETGTAPVSPPVKQWSEPEWEVVAPGISVKLLANDTENHRVSMLVRLEPDTHYPPHVHAGVEELHLLDGELWIEDRLLHPGDYNYGPPGGRDKRVYSETGCTCVLITSTEDVLG